MLQVKLPFVERIHPGSNSFVTGVKNNATADSELNDSSDRRCIPNCNNIFIEKIKKPNGN